MIPEIRQIKMNLTLFEQGVEEFREMEEGMCHCQLYVKTKDESIQG